MAEIGRVTRCHVSAYVRDRVHSSRLYPQEKRRLVMDLNGAIEPARTIVSAQWDIDAPYAVQMSDAQISADQRETSVLIQAAWQGDQVIRGQATLDDGTIVPQIFYLQCPWLGWFNDTMPVGGPSRLTVTAP